MSAESVRTTLHDYLDALIARGDYGRFFAEEVTFEVMGTDQKATGAAGVEEMIRWLHEIAFDAHPEGGRILSDDLGGAVEVVFAGIHTGEFAGIDPRGAAVRVPYSVFYDVVDDRITALRGYLPMDQLVRQIQPAPATTSAA
jgi:predicted ester cyclase